MKSSAGSKWENVSSISELLEKSNYSARFVQILGQKDMGHRRLSTFIYTVPTVAASRPLPLTAKNEPDNAFWEKSGSFFCWAICSSAVFFRHHSTFRL